MVHVPVQRNKDEEPAQRLGQGAGPCGGARVEDEVAKSLVTSENPEA